MSLKEDILKVLKQMLEDSKWKSVSTRDLMERLEIGRAGRKEFKAVIKDLEQRGEINRFGGGKLALPKQEQIVTGKVACHPDGYAFVVPGGDAEDVFIPPGDLLEAMHGDIVRARVVTSRRDGRKAGRVVEVVERARTYIVGRFRGGFVYPVNEKLLERVSVSKNRRQGAVDGELVEVRIIVYPTAGEMPEGEVICRLGAIDHPGVDLAFIVSEHNLPRGFPPEVVRAAKAVPHVVSQEDIEDEGRVDLRKLPLVTVDPESARDFDDAVHVKRERSGWRLWVAIADVSHYVTPGSALDTEALARSTSIYFPEGVIPMLPEEISAGIASLKPDAERLALVAEMKLDHRALVVESKFYPAVMKSAGRFSYNQVRRAMLEGDKAERESIGRERIADLEVMLELAKEMRVRRRERGTLDFDLPEALVILGEEGQIEEITKSMNDPTHQMVEEFMIAANEAVALYMLEKNLPALYRIHEIPSPEKLDTLSEALGSFGLGFAHRDMDRRALLKKLQKVLEKAAGKPHEAAVNIMTLRSMKQAKYDPQNMGHFGLASDNYLHFTSPIRRYPDLFVHRMLKLHLASRPARFHGSIAGLAENCSQLERRAETAERDMDKMKAARFMKDRIGREYDGYVVGVTKFGLFVEIADHFVEGMVHETRLPRDDYRFDERSMTLVGRKTRRTWRLGDKVKVIVAGASIEKRQIDFDLTD